MIPQDIAAVHQRMGRLMDQFTDKTILITGARGFLGRAFVEVLGQLPCRIIALDHGALADEMGAAALKGMPANVEYFNHDLTKPFHVEGRLDFIFSLAGIASPVIYKQKPLETADVCLMGTRNMLELAREKNARMLYSSSSEIYADPDVVPTPETHLGQINPHHPRAPYDVSKLMGETYCWIYHSKYGVDARIIRYFNVMGPGLSQTDYRVVGRFANAVLNGEPTKLYGLGEQTRTFCYITDALVGTLLVLLKGDFGPYNVGNDKPEISMAELAALFEKHRPGGPAATVRVSPPAEYEREPQRRCPRIERLQKLGYEPTVPIAEAVDLFMGWARDAYKKR